MLFFRWVLQTSARPSLLPITIHPSLSLAQCYLNPSPSEWTFHSCSLHGWKQHISILTIARNVW
jgi:hypothetical protein